MSFNNELCVYIHVPFCRHRCAYCSFVSFAGRDADIPGYISCLVQEINIRHQEGAEVSTIYFGGGTPSLLPADSISKVTKALKNNYKLADDVEITLEANPGTIDPAYLDSIHMLGVNRLSLGIQSLDDTELRLLGRIHTANKAREAVYQAQKSGFTNLNLDFIYGVPGRSPGQWREMLNEAVNLGGQHISLYGLTLEGDTPLHARVVSGETATPDDDVEAAEYEIAEKVLADAGYPQYEISNWAKPGFESRHNTAYWKRKPYLGLGVSAHSFLGEKRIANTCDLDEYMSALSAGKRPLQTEEVINETSALSEALFLGLRLNEGVSADDILARFSIDLYRRFSSEIAELVSLGLLERKGDRIRLTPHGRLLGNEVFIRFLA